MKSTDPINPDSGITGHYRIRNFRKLLRLAYRNLFRNRRRTFFAVLIAAAGCTALCIAIGYYSFSIYALQELTIRNGFGGNSGSAHVQLMDQRVGKQLEPHTLDFGLDSIEQLTEIIKKDPAVDYVLPRIEFGGLLSNGDKSVPFKGFGVQVEKEMQLWGGMADINPRLKLQEQLSPLQKGRAGIIIGQALARSLHAKVGDPLMIYSTTVDGTVNAVDAELLGIMSTGVSETDKYYLLTNIGFVQQFINTPKVSLLAVMFKNRDHFETKVQGLSERINKAGIAHPIAVVPWYEQAEFYLSIRDIFNIMFSFMGSIIIVIVLLSCWNIMNMTTMERMREIGTLRAMGLSIRSINTIFILEAFLIGVTGVVAGMILQVIISRIINSFHIIMPPVPGMSRPYTLQVYAATPFHPIIAVSIILAITLSSFSSFIIIRKYSIVESIEHT